MKYLNYKEGKKRVKAVARVVKATNTTPKSSARTPRIAALSTPSATRTSPFFAGYRSSPSKRNGATNNDGDDVGPTEPLRSSPAAFGTNSRPTTNESLDGKNKTASTPIMIHSKAGARSQDDPTQTYGSIIATPPSAARPLQLPDPAMEHQDSPESGPASPRHRTLGIAISNEQTREERIISGDNAYEVGETTPPPNKVKRFSNLRNANLVQRSSSLSVPGNEIPKPFIRRMFSSAAPLSKQDSKKIDLNMKGLHQVRSAQKDFFDWMDKELDKIETFYQEKEDQAGERLQILRDQLHIMRNRRIDEISEAMQTRRSTRGQEDSNIFGMRSHALMDKLPAQAEIQSWIAPIERVIDKAKAKTIGLGPNTEALSKMQQSPALKPKNDPGRDYVRRHPEHEVPYRSAKRKLKLALKEFYRGLELLKSYALLNRTGFRKINKKYDKAVNAYPTLRYMSEKVNKAHFVNSDILDRHIHAVEDLYARYFERGNHKIAVGKLRISNKNLGEYTFTAFRSGIMIGLGAVFAGQGLGFCLDIQANHPDSVIQVHAQYLLQIYAGYFLALFLFSLFCVDCSIWQANKINYPFIFEFDPRHQLDWRQLAEFPSFLFFLLGLFMWVNFSRHGVDAMFIYFPVILMGITVIVIFLPAPILFHRSRRWFVYSTVGIPNSNAGPKVSLRNIITIMWLTEIVAFAYGWTIPCRIS